MRVPYPGEGICMAQKVIVTMADDLDGHEGADVKTYHFGSGRSAYEIDLGEKNAKKFEAALAPYISKARAAGHTVTPASVNGRGARKAGRVTHVPASRTRASRDRGRDIRDWATAQGIPVGGRGRIPADVVAQYDATHP